MAYNFGGKLGIGVHQAVADCFNITDSTCADASSSYGSCNRRGTAQNTYIGGSGKGRERGCRRGGLGGSVSFSMSFVFSF